jgi:hypothetical protein
MSRAFLLAGKIALVNLPPGGRRAVTDVSKDTQPFYPPRGGRSSKTGGRKPRDWNGRANGAAFTAPTHIDTTSDAVSARRRGKLRVRKHGTKTQ